MPFNFDCYTVFTIFLNEINFEIQTTKHKKIKMIKINLAAIKLIDWNEYLFLNISEWPKKGGVLPCLCSLNFRMEMYHLQF